MKKIIFIFFSLFLTSCKLDGVSQEKTIKIDNSKKSRLLPGEPIELIEENTSIIEVFRHMALESDEVYSYLKDKISNNYKEFCKDFENKIIIIDIEVNNSIISKVDGRIYRFDDMGNLLDWDDIHLFKEVFEKMDIENFSFIEEESGTYDIRIEMEKLCTL